MQNYEDLIKKAQEAYHDKDFASAAKYYEQAFEKLVLAEDLVDLGVVYLDDKNPFKAVSVFQEAVENFPDFAYGFYGLGVACEDLGKKEEALRAYEQAIELDRTFYDAYFNIALMAEDEGNEQKAYDYYKKTLLYAPDHFWANLNLGSFYEKRDYLDLALEHTMRAYRIDPKEKMVAYNLGVVYGKMKDFEKAKKYYLEEISKSNGYILAYSNLAIILKDAEKDYKKARFYYLQGISKDKDNTLMWYNLGCLYVLMNDYENANNCLLYANMKDKTIFSYMEKDEELKEYRLTDSYQALLKKIKG